MNGKIVILEGTSCVGKTTLCESLKNKGWIVIPEAVRFLEERTGKKGDEASPIPGSQAEEEYYQDQLFEVELQRIKLANEHRKRGDNVVVDKSALAIIATAKAFEIQKGFNGTFKRAYDKYCQMLVELQSNNLVECDYFVLMTADYETIIERNDSRNHVLNGVWIDKNTINEQRKTLEKMTFNLIGKIDKSNVQCRKVDTSNLSKVEVQKNFLRLIQTIEIGGE